MTLGVEPGAHVGLYLRNSIAHVELMLACYKARAVPINVNWRYTDDRARSTSPTTPTSSQLLARRRHRARIAFERARRGAVRPAARLRRPRSGDDHYVLYTAARRVGRRASCGARRTSSSPRSAAGTRAARRSPHPRHIARVGARQPGATAARVPAAGRPGPPQFVALALGPLVHASGQWSALGTLLGGGKLVLYADAHVDMERVLDARRTRAGRAR